MPELKLPDHAPPIKLMIEFLGSNGIFVPEGTTWHETLKLLDHYQLWDRAGKTFERLGLVHPFDPNAIPLLTKYQLNMYAWPWSNKSCGELLEVLREKPTLCIGTYGKDRERSELTATGSFDACWNLFLNPGCSNDPRCNPGSCSEVAYRLSSAMLYIRPDCRLNTMFWNGHIEVWTDGETTEDVLDSYLNNGMPLSSNGLSDLFIGYYQESMLKNAVNGDMDKAREITNLLLGLNPNDTRTLTFKANDLIIKGEACLPRKDKSLFAGDLAELYFDDAKDIAKKIMGLGNSFRANWIFQLIEQARDPKAFSVSDAARSAAEDPWDSLPYKLRSLAELEQGNFGDALFYLNIASTMPNAYDDADIPKYMASIDAQLKDEIIRLGAEVLFDGSDAAELGQLYYLNGEREKTEEYLGLAIEIDPSDSRSTSFLASILKNSGKGGEAEEMLLAFLLANDSDEIRMYLANYYMGEEKYEKAERLFEALTRSEDKKYAAEGFNGLANIAYNKKHDPVAIHTFHQLALFADPNNVNAHIGIAESAIESGDFEVAKEHIEVARSIDPFDEWVYRALASYHIWRGEYDKAIAYAGLVERIGSYHSLNHFKGWALLDIEKFAAAGGAFKKALEDEPKNYYALEGMVIALAEQGFDYKEQLKKLLASDLPTEDIFYTIGRLAEVSGDILNAIKHYNYSVSVKNFYKDPIERLKVLGRGPIIYQVGTTEIAEAHRYAEENLLR